MDRERINRLYGHISSFHSSEDLGDTILDLKAKLKPELRVYQERAVKWMLKKESSEEEISIKGFNLVLPKGGILADEMGLGKTVEVLACILSNTCTAEEPALRKVCCKMRPELLDIESDDDSETYHLKKKRRKYSDNRNAESITEKTTRPKRGLLQVDEKKPKSRKGALYEILKQKYDLALSSMSCATSVNGKVKPTSNFPGTSIQCFCDNSDSNLKKLVECEICGIWQHAECLGIENDYTFGDIKCPQCWSKSDLIDAKATLIITPSSIMNQWTEEVQEHVSSPDFKYYVYRGAKSHSYIQPPTLAGYDIVITSYTVLCSDLNFVQSKTPRTLRHAKKYYCPTSPLVTLKWWRVCLDEAQMVEGFTSRTAIMAAQLPAVHRWAVTGTPIQKSIHDLFGLLVFLGVNGMDSEKVWTEYESDTKKLHLLAQHLMWRSSKEEVKDQLLIPPQTVLTHWLDFCPIEGHFYRTIHSECADSFLQKMKRFKKNLDVKLVNIDKKTLDSLLLPLLGVRQACTHPQVVRGKFVRFKHTMTMDELMDQMILNAKTEAEGSLRQLIAALHGLAAIHIIYFEWTEAVEKYREVLQLRKQYEESLKVDSLQMIHCLHNLCEVLENHGEDIPRTLRDSELRGEAEKLENNYLEKSNTRLVMTRQKLAKESEKVESLSKRGESLMYKCWWTQVLWDYEDDEELLNRIKNDLDDYVVPSQQIISKKLNSVRQVLQELSHWLSQIDSERADAMKLIGELQQLPQMELIQSAFLCHINNKKKKKNKSVKKCPICLTESALKTYEEHIFSVNYNVGKNEGNEESEEEENLVGNEKEHKEEKELKSVNVFRTNREGNWKPTPQERIIHVLAGVAKRVDSKLSEEGAQHLLLLESIRKEFKLIRAVWRTLSDQVYARDELNMAKLRLRLPLYPEEMNKNDNFIIDAFEVPFTQFQLKEDAGREEFRLRQTTGILFYLKNLQKTGTTEQECPVCKETLVDKWSVLICGHCCCYHCIPTLLRMSGKKIDCPLCRVKTSQEEISYVVAQKKHGEFLHPKIVGDHSTKVTSVISKLLSLIDEDPDVKVLIFSQWEKVLDIIKDALVQNDISFRRLDSVSDKFKQNLTQFKHLKVSVLLLPLKHGAKGLNLTEATHVFIVEPILNPADEKQAVGRIHRIGQTKPTWVHRFVVRNSIEERMQSSLDTSGTEAWAKENVTLRSLNDLFLLESES